MMYETVANRPIGYKIESSKRKLKIGWVEVHLFTKELKNNLYQDCFGIELCTYRLVTHFPVSFW